jgi:hypothetical protein
VERTTFDSNDIQWTLPNITGISLDTELLIECVNIWRMSGFNGMPPDPYEVAMMSIERKQVVAMANYIDFVRDEPKRLAAMGGSMRMGDM